MKIKPVFWGMVLIVLSSCRPILDNRSTLSNIGGNKATFEPWTFVSIPDFLNFDIEYPQKGWEDALAYLLNSMKAENPEFAEKRRIYFNRKRIHFEGQIRENIRIRYWFF